MKKKFLIKMFSVVAVLALIKNSVVLAKEEAKKQQQEKKFSPEEEKQKEQNIKTIKEILNKLKSLEEQMQKKLANMFKNFKKENYEAKNYDLEVFKKNNAPILIYTHKKTGAQVYFNLCLDKDKIKQRNDHLIFKVACKNNRGLTHFSEHCLISPVAEYFIKKLKISPNEINAYTSLEDLSFSSKTGIFGLNKNLEKEYVEKLTKELKSPSAFKEKSEIFEVEKKRILNEMKQSRALSYNAIDGVKRNLIREFEHGGEVLELEKVTLKDFKKFHEKYIHPFNCLLVKNVFELNPKTIKNYLNLWHENYFSYFEKREITGNDYEEKNKEKYLINKWAKDSYIFTLFDKEENKNKNFKYYAEVIFNLKNFKEKQKQDFRLSLRSFEKDIKSFLKDLGYEEGFFSGDRIYFYGNKKECFTKKALEENSKKIMDFVVGKLKGLNEEDFLYLIYYDLPYAYKIPINQLNLKNTYLWADPERYKESFLFDEIYFSFIKTKKAVSNKNLLVNDKKEIESSYESTEKNIKQNLKNNLTVYNKLAEIGPKYINVFEKGNLTLKQMFKKEVEKGEVVERVLPVKLKDKNSKKFVKDFAITLLGKFLNEQLNRKRGLVYKDIESDYFFENDFKIGYSLNKDSVKQFEDFLFKNFDEIIKDVEVKDEDFNEIKNRFKENFNHLKKQYYEYLKDEKKFVKDLENYIKTGKTDENSVLKKVLIRFSLFSYYPEFLINEANNKLGTVFKNYEDYNDFFEKQISFKEKYAKSLNEKITPEFAKDFLENFLKPAIKKLKNAFKLAEEKFKALEKIKVFDLEALVKTAYLVKDKEEIKKVNKNVKIKKERNIKLNKKINI